MVGRYVYGYLSRKFGVNPLHVFRENDVYQRMTTDGQMMDNRSPRHDSSPAVQ